MIGNLAINISVPRIAEYEGWQNATLRNDSLCVKLAVFQVLNSLAGAVMMFVYGELARARAPLALRPRAAPLTCGCERPLPRARTEGYTLTSEWYRMAGQMASAIMIFTMIITDSLGLLRLAACLKRVFAAPFARTQAYANRAFQSADPMYLAKRISLILKYVIIAMMLGPFFPVTYLLAAIGGRAHQGRMAEPCPPLPAPLPRCPCLDFAMPSAPPQPLPRAFDLAAWLLGFSCDYPAPLLGCARRLHLVIRLG